MTWGNNGDTISYSYDDNGSLTSKTTKLTSTNGIKEEIHYKYNLQNRLHRVEKREPLTNLDPLTDSDADDRVVELTVYTYNPSGIRVSSRTSTNNVINYGQGDEGGEDWQEQSETVSTTEYLIDSYNHTGYAQVLEETTITFAPDTNNIDNDTETVVVKDTKTRIQYTIGDDVISQCETTWQWRDNPAGTKTGVDWHDQDTGDTQYLLYDGHGSTRQLVDHTWLDLLPEGNIDGTLDTVNVAESYSYDAYGVMLQHENNFETIANDGLDATPGQTLPQKTNLLYAGEYFDTNVQHYNNRARWYNPYNGTFNRVDPYSGNIHDPQSLHKYLYCHANPVNAIDPSGMITVTQTVIVIAIVVVAISVLAIWAMFYRWVKVDGIKVRSNEAATVGTAFTNLKTNEPRMVQFLRDFQGHNLKIKLWNKQNGEYRLSERTVYWNPQYSNMGFLDAWSQAHPEVILGHELVHARHHLVENWRGVNPPAIPGATFRHSAEYRAVGLGPWAGNNFISENTLRQVYNLVPRTSYYSGGNPW